jgi:uncharacterized protein YjiS (DUF1127 family)
MFFTHIRVENHFLACAERSHYVALHQDTLSFRAGDSPAKPRNIPMIVTMIIAKFRSYLRYRETMRELARLSDRELDDLGLNRSEIEFVAKAHSAA